MPTAVPSRAIGSEEDMLEWLASPACTRLTGFVNTLADAVVGVPTSSELATSAGARVILAKLDKLHALADAHPPQRGVPTMGVGLSVRYGDPAFRDWHDAVSASALNDMTDLAAAAAEAAGGPAEGGSDAAAIGEEMARYWVDAFGSRARLDYGTGHEAAFAILLLVASELGALSVSQPAERAAVGAAVFPAYFALVRRLVTQYRLEPAGSHGVWCVDDYSFLPFLLGAAQLEGRQQLRPRGALDPEVVTCYADRYVFLEQVRHLRETKAASAAFEEACPILTDILRLSKSWSVVRRGLGALWVSEVLGKFPVAQHLLFGPTFAFATSSAGRPSAAPAAVAAKGKAALPAQPQQAERAQGKEGEGGAGGAGVAAAAAAAAEEGAPPVDPFVTAVWPPPSALPHPPSLDARARQHALAAAAAPLLAPPPAAAAAGSAAGAGAPAAQAAAAEAHARALFEGSHFSIVEMVGRLFGGGAGSAGDPLRSAASVHVRAGGGGAEGSASALRWQALEAEAAAMRTAALAGATAASGAAGAAGGGAAAAQAGAGAVLPPAAAPTAAAAAGRGAGDAQGAAAAPPPTGIRVHGWQIQAARRPLADARELEALARALGVAFAPPEMCFLNNHLTLSCEAAAGTAAAAGGPQATGAAASEAGAQAEGGRAAASRKPLTIRLLAVDALRGCLLRAGHRALPDPRAPSPALLRLPDAGRWEARLQALAAALPHIEVQQGSGRADESDWTFSTTYRGTFVRAGDGGAASARGAAEAGDAAGAAEAQPAAVRLSDRRIDYELLKKREPILWSEEVPLFESELDDNGVASLSARVRVMDSAWFVLMRFWLRVDGLLVRAYDTRLYHRFGEPVVLVEFTAREDTFAALAARGLPTEPRAYLDPNAVVQTLTVTRQFVEEVDVVR